MAKPSWGSKRTCPCGNGVRFYDLNKKEIECPSCGENINVEQLSISTLENNLRKKPQSEIINQKTTNIDNKKPDKNTIEIADDDPPTEVEEKIGKKKNKKKEKDNEDK